MIAILLVLIVVSLSCALPGVFLYQRRQSMITDAISHAVLLGIVLAFFLVKDLNSPLLFLGAGLFGLLTVLAIEAVIRTNLVARENASGIVFPLFFSLAVILISRYARGAHLDTDMVLMGEVILAPLDTLHVLGMDLPRKFFEGLVLLLVNSAFIGLFYRELKMMTFHEEYARLQGIRVSLLSAALMALVSLTAVVSFDAVGAILVISFMIAPAAAGAFFAKSLWENLLISSLFAIVDAVIGTALGWHYNVNIAGMCAFVGLLLVLLCFLFHRDGPAMRLLLKRRRKTMFYEELFILHLGHHAKSPHALRELGRESIASHIHWSDARLETISRRLSGRDEVRLEAGLYTLTEKGWERFHRLEKRYPGGGQ